MKTDQINTDIEIDLIEFIWKLLEHWKIIIIVGLVCGVLLGGYKYYRDTKEANTSKKDNLSIEELEKRVSEDELGDVNDALYLHNIIDKMQEYKQKSPLMNINAYDEDVVTASLYFDTSALSIEEAEQFNDAYMTEVLDTGFAEKLGEELGWDYEDRYIAELISVSNGFTVYNAGTNQDESTNAIIHIAVVNPGDVENDTIADALKKIVKEMQVADGEFDGRYSLSNVLICNKKRADQNTVDAQTKITATMNTKNNELDLITGKLDGDARLLYNAYVKDENAKKTTVTKKVTVSKTYIILGFILGCIFYSGYLFLRYVFSPVVSRVTCFKRIMPMQYVGRVSEKKANGNILTNSSFISGFRKDLKIPVSDQIEDVKSAIRFNRLSSNNTESQLSYLFFENVSDRHKKIIDAISDEKNQFVLPINDTDKTYKIVSEVEYAVIIAEDEKTNLDDFIRIMKLVLQGNKGIIAYVDLD